MFEKLSREGKKPRNTLLTIRNQAKKMEAILGSQNDGILASKVTDYGEVETRLRFIGFREAGSSFLISSTVLYLE